MVSHRAHPHTALVLASGSDADVADWSLELDKWVSLVVGVGRAGLALGAEVSVVADSALVTITDDVSGRTAARVAQRTVAADADVGRAAPEAHTQDLGRLQMFVDGDEAVIRVDKGRIGHARRAVVPIRAVEALMAHTADGLVAAVASGVVDVVPARREVPGDAGIQDGTLGGGSEAVRRVVAVLVLGEAGLAEVEILADGTVDKLVLEELLDARVAGTDVLEEIGVGHRHDPLGGRRDLSHDILGDPRLGTDGLGGAVDDDTVLDQTLDEPVVISIACDALVDAVLAEIEITIVAGRAVIVSIRDGLITAVAQDSIVVVGSDGRSHGSRHLASRASRVRVQVLARRADRRSVPHKTNGSGDDLEVPLHQLLLALHLGNRHAEGRVDRRGERSKASGVPGSRDGR
jgi:hypothetical protein